MRRIILVPGNFIKEKKNKGIDIYVSLLDLGIVPAATVEAEYGNFVLEGTYKTLAHHAPGWSNNPPPCIVKVEPIPEHIAGDIIVSHLDLDAIGGCLALVGEKPQDDSFWEAAAFIDLNGINRLSKLSSKIQDQLNAFYAWKQKQPLSYFSEITEVTNHVINASKVLEQIIKYDPNNGEQDWKIRELIQTGKNWYSKLSERVGQSLVFENEYLRVFKSEKNTYTASSYFSPKFERIVKATITYNTNTKALTLAFEDGGKEYKADKIMQELFGEDAGGHAGISGSPRGQAMTEEDFKLLWLHVDTLLQSNYQSILL